MLPRGRCFFAQGAVLLQENFAPGQGFWPPQKNSPGVCPGHVRAWNWLMHYVRSEQCYAVRTHYVWSIVRTNVTCNSLENLYYLNNLYCLPQDNDFFLKFFDAFDIIKHWLNRASLDIQFVMQIEIDVERNMKQPFWKWPWNTLFVFCRVLVYGYGWVVEPNWSRHPFLVLLIYLKYSR